LFEDTDKVNDKQFQMSQTFVKPITPVIVDSYSEKHTQGNKTDDVEMTWKGYFFRLTPRSSSASTNISELNPEATVFIPSAVQHQTELTDGTTYINSLTTPEQQQSEQPLQQTRPRRSARLREKRSAETARMLQLAPEMTSTDADE